MTSVPELAALLADVSNLARYNVDVQVGPRGVQLVAMRGGSLDTVKSGWALDLAAAWRALGDVLLSSLAADLAATVAEAEVRAAIEAGDRAGAAR